MKISRENARRFVFVSCYTRGVMCVQLYVHIQDLPRRSCSSQVVAIHVTLYTPCSEKKQPLMFSCITLRKSNQFEQKFEKVGKEVLILTA